MRLSHIQITRGFFRIGRLCIYGNRHTGHTGDDCFRWFYCPLTAESRKDFRAFLWFGKNHCLIWFKPVMPKSYRLSDDACKYGKRTTVCGITFGIRPGPPESFRWFKRLNAPGFRFYLLIGRKHFVYAK